VRYATHVTRKNINTRCSWFQEFKKPKRKIPPPKKKKKFRHICFCFFSLYSQTKIFEYIWISSKVQRVDSTTQTNLCARKKKFN
jgi:hypothetical protein